jgi:hypothetical protein
LPARPRKEPCDERRRRRRHRRGSNGPAPTRRSDSADRADPAARVRAVADLRAHRDDGAGIGHIESADGDVEPATDVLAAAIRIVGAHIVGAHIVGAVSRIVGAHIVGAHIVGAVSRIVGVAIGALDPADVSAVEPSPRILPFPRRVIDTGLRTRASHDPEQWVRADGVRPR